jgi:hypothetical protein
MTALYAQSFNVSAAHVCEWTGVVCAADCRVTGIFLASAPLSGTLPPALSALTALAHLGLWRSSLSGELHPSFAAWGALRMLGTARSSRARSTTPSPRGRSCSSWIWRAPPYRGR